MEIRIILIKPPSLDILTTQQPLGLAYLAAVLEKEGFPVKIIDAPILGYHQKEIIKEVKRYQPTIIGLTCVTPEFPSTLKLAYSLKKHFPKQLLIIGGPHVTATPQETLKYGCFDLVVLGEGEETIVELAKAIKDGKRDFNKIQGVAFRKKGSLVLNRRRSFLKNLDALPFPARHLLPPLGEYQPSPGSYKNLPVAPVITSRGCPFRCTFCDRAVFGNQVRFRSPKNVVDEIEILVNKFGAKEIRIWDDTFNLNPQRVKEICRQILERKLKFSWTCLGRVNFINQEMLEMMEKAGCWQISYGIESGNQAILNKIKKVITLKMAREAVAKTKKAGIEVKCFFMLGLPGETEKTMQETIDFAKKLDSDLATFSLTIPFPGTEIFKEAVKTKKIRKPSFVNFLPYQAKSLAVIPKGLNAKKIISYQRRAYWQFYFRPKIFIREFLKIRSLTQFLTKVRGFFSVQTKIPS